jgi:hypothetical protein
MQPLRGRRRLVREHDDLAAGAGREQRVALRGEAAAERGARGIRAAVREHDARAQAQRRCRNLRQYAADRIRRRERRKPCFRQFKPLELRAIPDAGGIRQCGRAGIGRIGLHGAAQGHPQPVLRLQRPARRVGRLRLMLHDPAQQRSRHARRDRIRLRLRPFAKQSECTCIGPQHRRPYRAALCIGQHHAVHLSGETDGLDAVALLRRQPCRRFAQRPPPCVDGRLGPAGVRRFDRVSDAGRRCFAPGAVDDCKLQ